MLLNRLAAKGDHGFEQETRLKEPLPPPSLGRPYRRPQPENPAINQGKGQGGAEQPQPRGLGGRVDAGLFFDAIAAEAVSYKRLSVVMAPAWQAYPPVAFAGV